jgi:hypothetical protein
LEELREALRGENAFSDPDDKARCIAEVDSASVLLSARKIRLGVIGAVAGVFIYLLHSFVDTATGRLAEKALNKLLELIPSLAPYLG